MPDERRQESELNRFWNELVEPAAEPDAGALDASEAETLRLLHAMTRTPPPLEARASVQGAMRRHVAPQHNGKGTVAVTGAAEMTLPARRSAPRSTAVERSWLAQFATALLLLVTIGLGYLAMAPQRRTSERVTGPPALLAPSTPPGTPLAMDTVFNTTLPADQIPTAGGLDFSFWRVSLEPNSRAQGSAQSRSCCPGPQITHVLQGDLTLRVAGPARIFRGGETALGGTEVLPYTEIVLRPGDTAVYDFSTPAEYANQGSQPVQVIGGGIFSGAVHDGPAGATLLDHNEESAIPALPAGPLTATLARVTVPPGEVVPSPGSDALMLDVGAAGDADIAPQPGGALRNVGLKEESIYILTLKPAAGTSASDIPPA